VASIVSSAYTLGHAQRNGTRYVTETHVWDGGLPPTVIEYGPVPDTVDHQAIANARAAQLMEQAAQAEFEEALNSGA
jgi:hypothetical protein